METLVLALLGVIFLLPVKGYRELASDADEAVFCMHRMHYILTPTSTCCNTTVVKSGINLDDHWGKCTAEPQDSDTVETAIWSVYACILKEVNGGEDSITLLKFGELMTEKYPDEFKDKIKEEIGTLEDVTADLTDAKALNKLRVSYFDVEREVCSSMPSETKEYGKVNAEYFDIVPFVPKDRDCLHGEEEYHRGGLCCETISYPTDIGWQSFMGMDLTLKMGSCNAALRQTVLMAVPDVMATNIVEMCDVTCEMIEKRMLQRTDLKVHDYASVNFNKIAMDLLPPFLPSKIKDEAVNYALGKFNINQTIERIDNYTFSDAYPGNSSTEREVNFIGYVNNDTTTAAPKSKPTYYIDFIQRSLSNNVKSVAVLCNAHKEILFYLQYYLETLVCQKEKASDTNSDAGDGESSGGEGTEE